ncbi:MAG: LPS export ABC transporter periplasmic protein LptC [Kistimonas sp.]|nr:LPS export ABC transporter periplasmic protein LptC [Kistimonas sp.]
MRILSFPRTIAAVVLLMAVVLLAKAVAEWLASSPGKTTGRHALLGASGEPVPSLFLRDVQVVEYNSEGGRASTLEASQIRHFEKQDAVLLEQPVLHTRSLPTSPVLHARADRGRASHDGTILELTDNVVITQPGSHSAGNRRLETEFVTLDTAQSLVWTDNPVRLLSAMDDITAEGMRFFYEKDKLQLSGKVQAVHALR